ncbi:AI-2E family transporter, partial [Pelomonas sp. HMWF004]
MSFHRFVTSPTLEHRALLALLIAVSLAFVWILLPLSGAVFWGVVIAIVFTPVHARLLRRWPQRRNMVALATLAVVVLLVVLPLALLTGTLLNEGAALYQRVQSGETNFARYFKQVISALPSWLHDLLARFGLADFNELQTRITDAVGRGSQLIATQVYSMGQNALDLVVSFFVMLYLAFFLLRDGERLSRRLRSAVPLAPDHRQR